MAGVVEGRLLLSEETQEESSRCQPLRKRWAPARALCLILVTVSLSIYLYIRYFMHFHLDTWRAISVNVLAPADEVGQQYLLGVGKADITGPVVEINMMGYADPRQVGSGLRQRLYSRAFIVGDVARPSDRFVYVVLDTQSGDTAVRYGILEGLAALGDEYAALYGHGNVAVTGTHSHAGPGAWLNYLLPQITSKGFDHQSYRAIVDGAVLSIRRAHESLQLGSLSLGSTTVEGAGINRSLFAYLANPEKERASYNHSIEDDGSVEKEMTLLKFQRASDGKNIGILTWYPTHGTSLLQNNTLISGDNKGVAAYLFERAMAGDESAAESFVAGFSQSNVGDVSPNVLGAWCEDGSGEMCSLENSTCPDGSARSCHGRGPLFRADDTGTASCFEIGRRQFAPALALYRELNAGPAAASQVRGNLVRFFHVFHNMSGFEFVLPNGSTVRTCPAALGYSFAAGTSDGPGHFDFTQHDANNESSTSPMWRVVRAFVKEPSREQVVCQAPKNILLDVGEMDRPYAWSPNVVDVQALRVGNLVVVVSPGEATTMAGRRWKRAVRASAQALSGETDDGIVVVLGGPANSYTHYITTEEEYAVQRYEGASTLYGPHTLAAYINLTLAHLPTLMGPANGSHGPSSSAGAVGPLPPDNSNRSLSFIPSVVADAPHGAGLRSCFGDVIRDVDQACYRRGETDPARQPRATFVGANPRNDLRLEGTYAAVERLLSVKAAIPGNEAPGREGDGEVEEEKKWVTVLTDADWHVVFRWRRLSEILGTSEAEIHWELQPDTPPGVYRLRYYGDSRSFWGKVTPFGGASSRFEVV